MFLLFISLEIKPCGLVSRIRDVEAFWYKREIKIIYFVPLCLILLIVSDCIVFLNIKNLGFGWTTAIRHNQKLKNGLIFFFSRLEADFFLALNVIKLL